MMSPEIAISICKWDKESTWYEMIREWNQTEEVGDDE